MLNINKAIKDDRSLRAIIGLDKQSFHNLLEKFTTVFELQSDKKINRQRAEGAGKKHTLEGPREKLFYILFYMKCYPTFDLAALIFHVDRSQTNRWVSYLQPLLEQTLSKAMVLPKRKIRSMEEFTRLFPEVRDIIIDGTERPIQRPSKSKRQKKHYSGKKKRHTKKNLIIADPRKKILVVTPSKPGKAHDYGLFKKSELGKNIPRNIGCWTDLGFNGIKKDFDLNVAIPKRKLRTIDLTDAEKQDNQIISSIRVIGENAIAGIKRLRCITDVCRNRKDQISDKFILHAAGIWNFYLENAA